MYKQFDGINVPYSLQYHAAYHHQLSPFKIFDILYWMLMDVAGIALLLHLFFLSSNVINFI